MHETIRLSQVVGAGYGEFWATQKRYRCSLGGRASKKSATASLWFIVNMMKHPQANLLVVRKVYKDHKDSTYTQLKWAIKRLNVESKWETKLSPLEIIYKPTGQKILFRGLDDPQSITSIVAEHGYICWAWIEEAFQISSEKDFDMVDGSIRGTMPKHLFKQITLTLNPWNEKHWIKKRFFDNPDEETFVMTTNYMCNEFIDDADRAFYDNLKLVSPRRYWVEGLGNWGMADGLIFENWEEREFDYKKIVSANKGIESAFGLDFGYTTSPTGFIAVLVDLRNKVLYAFDEHYEKQMLNTQIAKMIISKGFYKEVIVADSSEPKSIAEIKVEGITRIKQARKGKDSIANGIQYIQGFHIVVHPRCVNLIMELNNYAWETKDGIQINRPIDSFNHLIDPLRYALERFSRGRLVRRMKGHHR